MQPSHWALRLLDVNTKLNPSLVPELDYAKGTITLAGVHQFLVRFKEETKLNKQSKQLFWSQEEVSSFTSQRQKGFTKLAT